MAMQTGLSLSKIIIFAGAGYTGTMLINNGKLSEWIGELQASKDDVDYYDELKRLTMEVRQLGSLRQITVLNGNSSQVNYSGLIAPAAALGALGYGYMWWKGLKFSDLMYVTKRNMANAVSNLTKHLEQVSETLTAAKKRLTQRMQLLDDKLETQKEISKAIQNDVNVASENISQIGSELGYLQDLVFGLSGRIGSLEEKQDLANMGVLYLCNFVGGKNVKMPKTLEDQLKPSGRPRGLLTYSRVPSVTGLKDLTDLVQDLSRTVSEPTTVVSQDGIGDFEANPRALITDESSFLRLYTAKC